MKFELEVTGLGEQLQFALLRSQAAKPVYRRQDRVIISGLADSLGDVMTSCEHQIRAQLGLPEPQASELVHRLTMILSPLTHPERDAVMTELIAYRPHWYARGQVEDALKAIGGTNG